ncbi:MAG: hypothetical protein LC785_15195 [Acidobacteria bacterium]|nr:hypothetical protein [Acidobacteriota bacterium]
MNAKGAGLTQRQRQFLDALVRFGSVQRACDEARISQPTAWRWRQLAEFKREWRKARLARVEDGFSYAQMRSEAVMAILFNIAQDEEQPVFARIAACNSLKEHLVRGVEVADLEERIAEIEATLSADEDADERPQLRRVS